MAVYLVQRVGYVVVVLVIMSVLVFLATHALPASTAEVILGQYATPRDDRCSRAQAGADAPAVRAIGDWASGVLRGDLGRSLVMEMPVAPVLWTALGRSAVLAISALTVVSGFGIALGVLAAVGRGRLVDYLASAFTFVGLSVPEFF
jgi:peptide/nickel transport system permease protein